MQDTNNGKLRAGGEGVSLSVLPAQYLCKAKTALKIKFINLKKVQQHCETEIFIWILQNPKCRAVLSANPDRLTQDSGQDPHLYCFISSPVEGEPRACLFTLLLHIHLQGLDKFVPPSGEKMNQLTSQQTKPAKSGHVNLQRNCTNC